jgi:hypothetical protein
MKAPKKIQHDLKSSFSVTGKFRVPTNEFCSSLRTAPFIQLTKTGKPSTFAITEPDGLNNQELQVAGNKLVFSYSSNRRSTKEYAKNLLKFLSILSYLGDLYEPELPSIYPSIMELLVGYIEEAHYKDRKIENCELLIREIKTLSSMNCSLSIQILDLELESKTLEAKNKSLSNFTKDAIEGAMARIAVKNPSAEALSKVIGTPSEVYKAAKALVFENQVTK